MIYEQPVAGFCLCLNFAAGRRIEFSIANCSLMGRRFEGEMVF